MDNTDTMHMTLLNSAGLPTELQLHIARRAISNTNEQVLQALAHYKDLDPQIDDLLAATKNPTVLATWLTRPGRDHAEILEVLTKRTSIVLRRKLAALALPATALEVLAATTDPELSAVLCSNPRASIELRRQVVGHTTTRWSKLYRWQRSAVFGVIRNDAAAATRFIAACEDLPSVAAALSARKDYDAFDLAQPVRVLSAALEHSQAHSGMGPDEESLASSVARCLRDQTYLTAEMARRIAEAISSCPWGLHQASRQWAAHHRRFAAFGRATDIVSGDLGSQDTLVADDVAKAGRTDLAKALTVNPASSRAAILTVAHLVDYDTLAKVCRERCDDELDVGVLLIQPELAAAIPIGENRQAILARVVRQLRTDTQSHPYKVLDGLRQMLDGTDELDEAMLREVPVAILSCKSTAIRAKVGAVLARTLCRYDETRLGAFDTLLGARPAHSSTDMIPIGALLDQASAICS